MEDFIRPLKLYKNKKKALYYCYINKLRERTLDWYENHTSWYGIKSNKFQKNYMLSQLNPFDDNKLFIREKLLKMYLYKSQ